MGISFAGGLSMVAAGRPAIRDRLAFVFSFGGHGDLPRVLRYLCTGLEPLEPGDPPAHRRTSGRRTTTASPSSSSASPIAWCRPSRWSRCATAS